MGKTDIYIIGGSTVPDVPSTSSQEGVSGLSRSEYSNYSMIVTSNQNLFGRPEAPTKPHGLEDVNHFKLYYATLPVAFFQWEMVYKSPHTTT